MKCKYCSRELEDPQYIRCEHCRAKQREHQRKWYRKNLGYMHEWRQAHPESVKQYNETHRLEQKRWREANPKRVREVSNIRKHNYEARIKGNGGTFTFKELNELLEKQEGFCFYCGELLYSSFDKEIHIEHKIPISRGGPNDISNIALSCARCNLQKGTKTDEEFLQARNA